MKVLSFICQRSFARYVAIDLAEGARALGWSVHWLDLEGRLTSNRDRPDDERRQVVDDVLAEIEAYDPHLVFSYGLRVLSNRSSRRFPRDRRAGFTKRSAGRPPSSSSILDFHSIGR